MSKDQFEAKEEDHLEEYEIRGSYSKESFIEKIAARSRIILIGLSVTVVSTIGVAMYASAQEAGQYGAQNGQYSAQYAVQTNGTGATAGDAAGGGGCGGGSTAGGGGGGCCGGGGGSAGSSSASVSPADLEKQALKQYKTETGKTDVTVKVENRGCHTQIDIYDKSGKIVRSYGYQGGSLYVI